ncbi:hypothetical protein [Corynebacterium xerosis]|uniref:hypothetical protein n=1 Tax=Corynebacterium xerosis TaxID=1725 RepID=UPI0013CE842E|nr:hypothetical protein [Corynebacterium xerosis]
MFHTHDDHAHDHHNCGHRTHGRRGIGALTASAAATVALTAATITPAALAAPAAPTTPAADQPTATAPAAPTADTSAKDARLAEAIKWATLEGHLSDDYEWVADPLYPFVDGGPDGLSAQVITVSGATGSSPQAVILFGSGHANFSDAAVAPEGFAAHESFGDATGQVESVEQADPDTITVTWKGPDGELRAVDHRQQDGRIVVE